MPGNTFTEKTWVPAGIAVAACGALMGAAWWVKGTLSDIGFEQRLASERMGRIEDKLDAAASNAVNERDLRLWIMDMARKNEGKLLIPEWVR